MKQFSFFINYMEKGKFVGSIKCQMAVLHATFWEKLMTFWNMLFILKLSIYLGNVLVTETPPPPIQNWWTLLGKSAVPSPGLTCRHILCFLFLSDSWCHLLRTAAWDPVLSASLAFICTAMFGWQLQVLLCGFAEEFHRCFVSVLLLPSTIVHK